MHPCFLSSSLDRQSQVGISYVNLHVTVIVWFLQGGNGGHRRAGPEAAEDKHLSLTQLPHQFPASQVIII
jgi:hypothetical protein